MDILYNNKLINEIVEKLFKHRRSEYSQFNLDSLIENLQLEHQIIRVMNSAYEKLYGSLLRLSTKAEICIVFLHGYGSNRLECSNLLKGLTEEYALCAFDFSGSGKSEGDRITYGAKEKQDINSIIIYLRQAGFKKFVLWGRSMGATSSLLYCLKYQPKDVILQVVDSPFYSFEMIAFEIAQKNVKAPQFIINFAIELAKKNCSKFMNNPFDIELSDIQKCRNQALFVYCEQDNVINSKNTHLICSKYKCTFQKLVIQQNHNTIRHQSTVGKIYQHIEKYAIKNKISQTSHFQINKSVVEFNKELSFDALENVYFANPSRKIKERLQKKHSQQFNKSTSKKGIERVELNTPDHNVQRKYDDYGFTTTAVGNRFVHHQPRDVAPRLSQLHQPGTQAGTSSSTPSKRPYLSLTTSFDAKSSLRQSNNNVKMPKRHDNKSMAEDIASPSIYQVYSKYTTTVTPHNQKSRMKKKMSTVKSIAGSRCLDHTQYLD